MLGVDNCGFMLCSSENNQNQQQGQFLFCFCFKYQSQLFYASNTTEKALKKYQIMGVKFQFCFVFLGGGFFLLFLLLWHNTQPPKYYEQANKIGHISKQFP